jgi:hypothetical protein
MKFDEMFDANALSVEQAQAMPRVVIVEGVEEAQDWIFDSTALLQWLVEHPTATAEIGRWSLTLFTPHAEDLIGLGHFDPPSGLEVAVEEYSTSKSSDGFSAWWAFG